MLNLKLLYEPFVSEEGRHYSVYCAQYSDNTLFSTKQHNNTLPHKDVWTVFSDLFKTFREKRNDLDVNLIVSNLGLPQKENCIKDYSITITQVTVQHLEVNPHLISHFGQNWDWFKTERQPFFTIEITDSTTGLRNLFVGHDSWMECCNTVFAWAIHGNSNITAHFTFKNC